MNNRFSDWHNEIDKITLRFNNKFRGLNHDELNWKPNSKSWSIGQVIEHLVKTSEAYFNIPKLINNRNFKPSFITIFSVCT